MNSIGGDGFWLISKDGKAPIAVDGCGAAAQAATVDFYRNKGFQRSRRAVRWPRTQSQARCRAGPK
jgi:gamma-glutamyltranspeptidase